MNRYEKTVASLNSELIIDDIAELPPTTKGYYTDEYGANVILINKNIKCSKEKRCILAEELGHYYTTVGDITDQTKIENRKQELKARRWAVKKLIKVEDFIRAFEAGVRNRAELAEFLDVTESFIETSLDHFRRVYGHSHNIGDYVVNFDPLWVYKSLG